MTNQFKKSCWILLDVLFLASFENYFFWMVFLWVAWYRKAKWRFMLNLNTPTIGNTLRWRNSCKSHLCSVYISFLFINFIIAFYILSYVSWFRLHSILMKILPYNILQTIAAFGTVISTGFEMISFSSSKPMGLNLHYFFIFMFNLFRLMS